VSVGDLALAEAIARATGALLRERFGTPLDGDRERDRAWRLLVRRGYPSELAYDAVRLHELG